MQLKLYYIIYYYENLLVRSLAFKLQIIFEEYFEKYLS